MRIVIEPNTLNQDLTNLGQVINHYEKVTQDQGQVICQVELNGEVLSEADEKRLGGFPRTEIHSLVFLTENPELIPARIVSMWQDELPRVIQSVDELSRKVRFQGFEGHLYQIVQLVDTCQFFVDSLVRLQARITDSDKLKLWHECEQKLVGAVGETLKAFQAKDLIRFSENLEYDLADALQRWLDVLAQHSDFSSKP